MKNSTCFSASSPNRALAPELDCNTKFEVRRPCHSEDMAHDVCQH